MTPDKQGPAPVDVELAREVRRVNDPHLQPNHEALRSDGWREAAARIIDRLEWHEHDRIVERIAHWEASGTPIAAALIADMREHLPSVTRDSLAKADAIAALPQAPDPSGPQGGEGEA